MAGKASMFSSIIAVVQQCLWEKFVILYDVKETQKYQMQESVENFKSVIFFNPAVIDCVPSLCPYPLLIPFLPLSFSHNHLPSHLIFTFLCSIRQSKSLITTWKVVREGWFLHFLILWQLQLCKEQLSQIRLYNVVCSCCKSKSDSCYMQTQWMSTCEI